MATIGSISLKMKRVTKALLGGVVVSDVNILLYSIIGNIALSLSQHLKAHLTKAK